MRWTFSGLGVLLLAPVVWAAEPKDPMSLDVPAAKTAAAKELIRKLDDDVLVRDKLTRELKEMGRDALPAMLDALKGKPPERVALPLRAALPAAREADFDARAELFLADKEGKQTHELLGWNELVQAVGDTKESRLLFADLLADDTLRANLLLAKGTTRAEQTKFDGRWQVKWKSWFGNGYYPPEDDPFTFVAACWLMDLATSQESEGQGRNAVVGRYLKSTKEGKLVLQGKGSYGTLPVLLLKKWMDSRRGYIDLKTAYSWARDFKFGEEAEVKALVRMADWSLEHKTGHADAIAQLAGMGKVEHIPILKRFFDSEVVSLKAIKGSTLAGDIQWRDIALAMCLVLTDQDPAEYGFGMQQKPSPELRYRANPQNYFFVDGDGKTADEKRKAAFAKWAEWEKANPDKIKAKAPDKK
jgi:hypothetical protein